MQQALIRFCVGAKIPAHGEIAKFFLAGGILDLADGTKNHPNVTVDFFSKQVFAILDLLFISAAHQRSRFERRTCWGIVQW
ncbi:hypothetical protein K9B32_03970 [Rhizobium sp. 3T7]|uniref:hypothetical protein n=1 Tax=Rhizobium sp. 3T7 TaxID=2874922 RepID=UPI001CC97B25|nr:hypothetical protein [Rhizobium sp. 3T7]MBZ9789286.1 hypothetical protein [Rhizobium sp. 3T7]